MIPRKPRTAKRSLKISAGVLAIALVLTPNGVTENTVSDTHPYTNRLAREKSPYLLQHAHNPVDWFPWGPEAFEKAKKEDKPVFLSIGYSTCHWCHVMEEESFENPEIAQIMNDGFVSIKVDREERPDLDQIYMQAVMALTGSGGWPMSVFLTPEGKPFYGGTYFPPEDRWGRPGFATLLHTIQNKWTTDKLNLLNSSDELTRLLHIETKQKPALSYSLNEGTLQKAFEQFQSRFDSRLGGFGQAPKFPSSHNLSFLLHAWKRFKTPEALLMVEKTLQAMARGGMDDQLGGGFHRYSTDAYWHVPHFEKMLYDQALLSKTYLQAYQATAKEEYAQIAREIFDYVLRDMTDPSGGFYSAEDADSAVDPEHLEKKSEGAFYIWSESEIKEHLGPEVSEIFNAYFGVEPGGNARQDPQGEFTGKNILYVALGIEDAAKRFSKKPEDIQKIINDAKGKLFKIRAKRPRPHLDDKVLTDWNSLMISSLALGARVLEEPKYKAAAQKAADFILTEMKQKNGRLLHRWRKGEPAIPGFVDDYAFFILALLDLYEATFDPKYLEEARFFTQEMIRLFWDEKDGGFFFTGSDAEKLITRSKELYDGAVPSGNSVAALCLLRVGRMTMERELEKRAQAVLDTFSAELNQYPSGYSQMLAALDFALGPSREIIIASPTEDPAQSEVFLHEIFSRFLPNKVVMFHPLKGNNRLKIETLAPFISRQTAVSGKATVYICKDYVCDLPVTDAARLNERLKD